MHWAHWDQCTQNIEHRGNIEVQQTHWLPGMCVWEEAWSKVGSPENFLVCEGRSHFLYYRKLPASIWVRFCSCLQLGQRLALPQSAPWCFSWEMRFSFSLSPPAWWSTFWFTVVLAVGQLALMALNISGKYFQQLWLEGIQINSRHLHPLYVQSTIFWLIFPLVSNLKKNVTQEKLLSKEPMKNQAVFDTRRFTYYVCKECDQLSAKMSVRSENGETQREWVGIHIPTSIWQWENGPFPPCL